MRIRETIASFSIADKKTIRRTMRKSDARKNGLCIADRVGAARAHAFAALPYAIPRR